MKYIIFFQFLNCSLHRASRGMGSVLESRSLVLRGVKFWAGSLQYTLCTLYPTHYKIDMARPCKRPIEFDTLVFEYVYGILLSTLPEKYNKSKVCYECNRH